MFAVFSVCSSWKDLENSLIYWGCVVFKRFLERLQFIGKNANVLLVEHYCFPCKCLLAMGKPLGNGSPTSVSLTLCKLHLITYFHCTNPGPDPCLKLEENCRCIQLMGVPVSHCKVQWVKLVSKHWCGHDIELASGWWCCLARGCWSGQPCFYISH